MALDKFQPYLFVSAGEQSNKYLTPVISPNGIASFQAQRSQSLTGLTVRIDPIQEGSGDPSPTNIRPISGRTGLTVTRAGKNLAKFADQILDEDRTQNGVTFHALNESTVRISGTATGSAYLTGSQSYEQLVSEKHFYKAGTYTMSSNLLRNASNYAYLTGFEFDGTPISRNIVTNVYDGHPVTFTMTSDFYANIQMSIQSGSDFSNGVDTWVQIAPDSTATAYEPYTGATYPVSWQTEAGTVYGGTLDVVSGVLTVKYGYVDLGTLDWAPYSDASRHIFRALPPTPSPKVRDWSVPVNAISSQYTAMAYSPISANDNGKFAIGNNRLVIIDHRYSTNAEFQSAMDGVQMVYELATPQTYQLTGAEVRTIAGFNQIYSDAGPVIDIKF